MTGDVVPMVSFFVVAATCLVGAIGVVTARTVFTSALFLVLALFGVAGLYVLLNAGFLAVVQILIYVGAISVLILFAIMLTQTKDSAPARLVFHHQAGFAAIASLVIAITIALAVAATEWDELSERVGAGSRAIASALFTDYVLPLEIVGVLLLAAVIGGVFLAKREPGGPS